MVFLNPNAAPETSNIRLLGPGVTEVTNANKAMAASSEKSIRENNDTQPNTLRSSFRIINDTAPEPTARNTLPLSPR